MKVSFFERYATAEGAQLMRKIRPFFVPTKENRNCLHCSIRFSSWEDRLIQGYPSKVVWVFGDGDRWHKLNSCLPLVFTWGNLSQVFFLLLIDIFRQICHFSILTPGFRIQDFCSFTLSFWSLCSIALFVILPNSFIHIWWGGVAQW